MDFQLFRTLKVDLSIFVLLRNIVFVVADHVLQGFLSRTNKADSQDVATSSSDTIPEEPPSSALELKSNKFISRPPPLAPNVEKELRDACRSILRDLKPSGHDIEDRRMKSDIFVDHDPFAFDHKVKPAARQDDSRARKSHSATAWAMDGGKESDQQSPTTKTAPTQRFPVKPTIDTVRASQLLTSHVAERREVLSPLTAHAATPGEGPLAPLPTGSNQTRTASISASSHLISSPHPAQRTDSASTQMSMPFTPTTDQYKSGSTAMTSNSSSNRASEHVYTAPTSAKDGEWMKQEVERHKQAQALAPDIATIAGASAFITNDSLARSGSPRPDRIASPRPLPDVTEPSHPCSNVINPAKRLSTASRSSSRYSSGSFTSTLPSPSPAASQAPVRLASTGSRRHSRPGSRLSIDGIHETRTSPQPTPRNEDVPPVPRLDAERLSSLTSTSRNNYFNLAATTDPAQEQERIEGVATDRLLVQKAQDVRDSASGRAASPTPQHLTPAIEGPLNDGASDPCNTSVPKSTTQIAPQAMPRNMPHPMEHDGPLHQQTTPHLPNTTNPNVATRDFYRLKPGLDAVHAIYQKHDPTPADFDALMSAMDGAVHGSPLQQQAGAHEWPITPASGITTTDSISAPHVIPTRRSSLFGNSRPPTQSAQPSASLRATLSDNAITAIQPPPQPTISATQLHHPLPPTSAPEQAMSLSNGIVVSQAPHSPTCTNVSQRSSYIPPSRTSQSYSSTTSAASKKDRKGVSKFLWKLGGGDVPPPRLYVPDGYMCGHTSSGNGKYGEEYWSDDEERACAAPVVGFGRGW